jgi:hypothetical protein
MAAENEKFVETLRYAPITIYGLIPAGWKLIRQAPQGIIDVQ